MVLTAIVLAVVLLLLWLKFAHCDAGLFLARVFSRKDPKKFHNKVVWITGASQGLGRLLALRFAEKGSKLILSSRSAERLQVVTLSATASPSERHLGGG